MAASFEEAALDDPPPLLEADPDCGEEPICAGAAAAGCGGVCCGAPWIWGRADYLLWWTKGMDAPPLVTTSPAGTPRDDAGVLGRPGTSVLFGGAGLNDESRSGGRYTLGHWFNPCCGTGIEATFVSLGDESSRFSASRDGYAILARPFFNFQDGVEDAHLIAMPDLFDGTVTADATTKYDSLEVLLRRTWARGCYGQMDLLIGYRGSRIDDRLLIEESTISLAGAAQGSTINLFDRFDADNRFHGAELGASWHWRDAPCWSLEFLAKLALGNTSSTVTIDGQTVTTTAAGTATTPGGLLAQPTNMGRFEQDHFTTITELGATLRRQLTCSLDFTFGYTLVYWSEVARAGDQVDFDLNPSQLPPGPLVGAPAPQFSFVTEGFWAQGLHFGLEYNF